MLSSWRSILGSRDAPRVTCTNPTAHVLDGAGFVLCEERVGSAVLVATNVFVYEDGAWKMVHHQAAAVARDGFVVVPDDDDEDASSLN